MIKHKKEPEQMTSHELLETYTLFSQLPSYIRTEEEQIYLSALREEMLKRME
mgnify:FL=1